MMAIRLVIAWSPGKSRRTLALFVFCVAVFASQRGGSAQGGSSPDALSYFKGYFVTGDYLVSGVGLRGRGVSGLATGTITMPVVPAHADVLAAFLYWQAVATDSQSGAEGATFKGNPLTSVSGPIARVISPDGGTAACWSAGAAGGIQRTFTYRADVLRFFDVGPDGKFVVSGPHTVQVPDAGPDPSSAPVALGASLLVIYRDPDPSAPLNSVVIYDGGYTMDSSHDSMSQTIRGFYQVATSFNPNGRPNDVADKITHIVGSGQSSKSERLLFDDSPLAVGPFSGATGNSWDNYTFSLYNPAPGFRFDADGAQYVTTTVDHQGFSTFDCLSWGAIVYRTEVKDTDRDGLLDLWESSATPLHDPSGAQLPNLAAMGASPTQKDLFIEIGYLYANSALSYGGAVKPAHSHLPDPGALQLVAEAAHEQGIKVHFDVGGNYQSGLPSLGTCLAAWEWRCAIVPSEVARGGEAVDEMVTVCPTDAARPWVCQFSAYPGTVGWKTGFRFLRDALVQDDGSALPSEGACPPAATCTRRRFDHNRTDMFHYVLFGHALGLPKSTDETSPAFHVPRTNTGVADLLGGDSMVTLGAFDDVSGKPVGTPFMQASTLLHELGHTFGRRHGGELREPNCKPNYLSVMNYLFQLRGLLDQDGIPRLDLSGQKLESLNEASLLALNPVPQYRTAWYAPRGPGTLGPAATKHCDGSAFSPEEITAGISMVRVDGLSVAGAIDWNPNPLGDDSSLDVNFDGITNDGTPTAGHGPVFNGSNDWAQLRLNQLASRRNVGGLYVRVTSPCSVADPCLAIGPLSLDLGQGDLGQGDLGQGDLGQGDLGQGDLGQGDLGQGDLGRGLLGQGDLGQGDLGQGDLGVGVGSESAGELDLDIALAVGRTPPNEVSTCVIKGPNEAGYNPACRVATGLPLHRVRIDWKPPHVGTALRYFVYRMFVDPLAPVPALGAAVLVGAPVPVVSGRTDYSLLDLTELPNGQQFTYFVVAEYADGPDADALADRSAPSIFSTITAVNAAPIAVANAYTVKRTVVLTVAAQGVLSNDVDVDGPQASMTAVLVTGPLRGALVLNANGGFTYTPSPVFVGADTFTYKTKGGFFTHSSGVIPMSGESNTVTVTITTR